MKPIIYYNLIETTDYTYVLLNSGFFDSDGFGRCHPQLVDTGDPVDKYSFRNKNVSVRENKYVTDTDERVICRLHLINTGCSIWMFGFYTCQTGIFFFLAFGDEK